MDERFKPDRFPTFPLYGAPHWKNIDCADYTACIHDAGISGFYGRELDCRGCPRRLERQSRSERLAQLDEIALRQVEPLIETRDDHEVGNLPAAGEAVAWPLRPGTTQYRLTVNTKAKWRHKNRRK